MDQLIYGRTPSDAFTSNPMTVRAVASHFASLWRFSLVALTATMMSIASASAHGTHISRMEYTNNGSYVSWFFVRYKYQGKYCKVYLKGNTGTTSAYKTAYVDLTKDFKNARKEGANVCLNQGKIPENVRVWGFVKIPMGDDQSCKKSVKLYYSSSSNRTQKYKTGGTTLNNNRCKNDN